ncbi:unnamed protein product [Prorocentrum cordatum]|uniref:Uncharacterized protein n=1 Tax=Prorocentrum cordatum TaxID=2364126 RepID=A0ABN9PE77_9DINO|nr:unnamed protein product [Polarella glacialis]
MVISPNVVKPERIARRGDYSYLESELYGWWPVNASIGDHTSMAVQKALADKVSFGEEQPNAVRMLTDEVQQWLEEEQDYRAQVQQSEWAACPRQACRRPGEALRGPGGLCEASDRVAGLCGGLSVERSTDTSSTCLYAPESAREARMSDSQAMDEQRLRGDVFRVNPEISKFLQAIGSMLLTVMLALCVGFGYTDQYEQCKEADPTSCEEPTANSSGCWSLQLVIDNSALVA